MMNMCPVIGTDPSPGKVCYMISKMGMARLAIGIAAEHRDDGIAANALWPRTIIESQASINWGMLDRGQWRTPEIVCDAAMDGYLRAGAALVQRPRGPGRGRAAGARWGDRLRPLLGRGQAAGEPPVY